MAINSDIRDQAYQFFIQEAPDLLQTIETGLLTLSQDRNMTDVHQLMRAAHSLKGGSASVGLDAIATISHRLENIFKVFYDESVAIDLTTENQLLQAYDCLRLPLRQQIETGFFDVEEALAIADPVFTILENRFRDVLADVENYIPTSEDLGVDMVLSIFEVDVAGGLEHLAKVATQPNKYEVSGELRAQAEVFAGFAEILNLKGFGAIADSTMRALDENPDQVFEIAQLAIQDFERVRQAVLAGDRALLIEPSESLLALTEPVTDASTEAGANEYADTDDYDDFDLLDGVDLRFSELNLEFDNDDMFVVNTFDTINDSDKVSNSYSEEVSDSQGSREEVSNSRSEEISDSRDSRNNIDRLLLKLSNGDEAHLDDELTVQRSVVSDNEPSISLEPEDLEFDSEFEDYRLLIDTNNDELEEKNLEEKNLEAVIQYEDIDDIDNIDDNIPTIDGILSDEKFIQHESVDDSISTIDDIVRNEKFIQHEDIDDSIPSIDDTLGDGEGIQHETVDDAVPLIDGIFSDEEGIQHESAHDGAPIIEGIADDGEGIQYEDVDDSIPTLDGIFSDEEGIQHESAHDGAPIIDGIVSNEEGIQHESVHDDAPIINDIFNVNEALEAVKQVSQSIESIPLVPKEDVELTNSIHI
ncbi:MAG: Hpt domain-containing protein, partial [Cyanobacteria bacterium P01_A01_bin.37]